MQAGRRKAAASEAAAGELGQLQTIPLDLVADPKLPARENMDQAAMEELKQSMQQMGLLSPIVVVKRGEGFEVVAGHRRTLAARALLWPTIRAMVYPADWTDQSAAMLHENIIRENLNAAQEGVFFTQLLEERKLDEEGLCKLVKRSAQYVASRLELLRKDQEVFQALREGRISFAVARELNRFPEEQIRRYHLDQAIRSGTSSRVVEQWYNEWKSYHVPTPEGGYAAVPSAEAVAVEPSPGIECFMCGGSKDPYNLVSVLIHKWELIEVKRILAAAEVEVQNVATGVTPATGSVDKPNGGVK
jgi:ParB/RepB/Spo0J family partition protein